MVFVLQLCEQLGCTALHCQHCPDMSIKQMPESAISVISTFNSTEMAVQFDVHAHCYWMARRFLQHSPKSWAALQQPTGHCHPTDMCDVVFIGSVAQRFLARHHTVLQIGSTVFVHGGILPSHADYGLERINRSVHLPLHATCTICTAGNACCILASWAQMRAGFMTGGT